MLDTRPAHAPGWHARGWWTMLALSAVLGALLAMLPATADARPGLGSASPGPGTHLSQSPGRIDLELGGAWTTDVRTTVDVLGPDNENLARGRARVSVGGVSQRVAPANEQGAHQVVYRMLMRDGRTVVGSYWFIYEPGPLATGRTVIASTSLAVLTALTGVVLLRRGRTPVPATPATPAAAPAPPGTGPRPVPVPRQRDRYDVDSASPLPAPPRPGRGL